MPQRIQRRRTKGWRMPEGAVVVTRPTSWGNPFGIGRHYQRGGGGIPRWGMFFIYNESFAPRDGYTTIQTRAEAVDWFRWYVGTWSEDKRRKAISELRGKDLACFCPLDQPCHADVLLELANG